MSNNRQEYKDWTREDLIGHIELLDRDAFDHIAKVIELINVIGWEPDDTYTFNDGDRWSKFDPLGEEDTNE